MPKVKERTSDGGLDLKFLVAVGFAIIFTLGVAYFFYGLQSVVFTEAGEDPPAASFKISKGEGFREIGARLSRESLVRSLSVFKFYALVSGSADRLQPGVHELSYAMSVPQIVSALTQSGKNEARVTIPEGFTLKDIDGVLRKANVLNGGNTIRDFPVSVLANNYPYLKQIVSIEGFLFPDTYDFKLNSSPEEVLRVFLNNFNRKAWPPLKEKDNWYDILILASFLEKEVPEFEDRQIVAGVLLKRLRVGMPLQIDAGISYAKCDGAVQGCADAFVRREDVDIKTPYNTYLRLGWTPTPISNPGKSAIEAALTPVESPYWYYLSARETKETMFSVTLEEHNAKRAIYLLGN